MAIKYSISLVLSEGYGSSNFWTRGGHAGIYLEGVVMGKTSPKLRHARSNDKAKGVLIGRNYKVSAESYDWLAVPLNQHLYSVDDPADAPLFINEEMITVLKERSFKKYFKNFIETPPGSDIPAGSWVNMFGEAFNRELYFFTVGTDKERMDALIEHLNESPNLSNFNFFFENCSDFAKRALQEVFPEQFGLSVSDLMLTSPKGVAQQTMSLANRLLEENPNLNMTVSKVSQVPSVIRQRSDDPLHAFENAVRNKVWAPVIAYFQPGLFLGFTLFFRVFRRFEPHDEYRKFFNTKAKALTLLGAKLSAEQDVARRRARRLSNRPGREKFKAHSDVVRINKTIDRNKDLLSKEQAAFFGSEKDWKKYRDQTKRLAAKAVERGIFRTKKDAREVLQWLTAQCRPVWRNGQLELSVQSNGRLVWAGASRRSVLKGDAELSFKILLGRILFELDSRAKDRGTLAEFEKDWSLLLRAGKKLGIQL